MSRGILRSAQAGLGALLTAAMVLPAGNVPAIASAGSAVPPNKQPEMALTQFVNPFIGTAVNSASGYAGNISPGAKVPFGMVTFGPDMPRTDFNGSGGYLTGADATSGRVNFFSLTHLNGPGCPGQGTVGMMPASTPEPVADANGIPSGVTFKTATESASPGRYAVTLDNGVKADLTATNRTGMAQFTFPNKDSGYFSIDTRLNGNSNMSSSAGQITPGNVTLNVGADGRSLSGRTVAPAFCTPYGTPYNSNVYFYAEFDKPLRNQPQGSTVNTVKNGAATFQYDLTAQDPTLTMRVGISPVSVDNARLNLETENAASSFEQVKAAADAAWNQRLNRIQVDEAKDPAQLSTDERQKLVKFYTALYRVFGSPTTYSDVNGDFRSMQASGQPAGVDRTGGVEKRPVANVADYTWTRPDGSVGRSSTHYSGLSMWDTYRSQAQLLALLAPDVASEVMQSLVVDAKQCGAFPHWVDASDDSTPMAGDNALPDLAGSYAFGATDFDVASAAQFTKQSVFDPASACNGNASMPDQVGYLERGYYPSPEWSSTNIERYNSDRAAAAFLDSLPASVRDSAGVSDSDLNSLYDRAGWWRNIFDDQNKVIASREAPTEPGQPGPLVPGTFHESTEPNYFWSFGYAWTALINAIGGKGAAVSRLNRLFGIDNSLSTPPTVQDINGGQDSQQYYIGNEMGLPDPWAYNWAGKPASTQYIVQQIMRLGFGTGRDGLPGNDDMGATSSWYVFAALGMFPVVASTGGLALSTPQFPAATVWMQNKPLRIVTDRDASAAPFISSLRVGNSEQPSSWLPLRLVRPGTQLSYVLSTEPTAWASADNLTPPSGADANYNKLTASG